MWRLQMEVVSSTMRKPLIFTLSFRQVHSHVCHNVHTCPDISLTGFQTRQSSVNSAQRHCESYLYYFGTTNQS